MESTGLCREQPEMIFFVIQPLSRQRMENNVLTTYVSMQQQGQDVVIVLDKLK